MTRRSAVLLLSSSLFVAGLAFLPAAQAQSTIIVLGGGPDVVYMDAQGNVHELIPPATVTVTPGGTMVGGTTTGGTMTGGTMTGGNMHTMATETTMGPINVQGINAQWVPGLEVPAFTGVVYSYDPVGEYAIVRSAYGFVHVPTGAGATVLHNGKPESWLTVPPGAIVQLPISYLVTGPIPHRVTVDLAKIMSPGMGMTDMGSMTVGPVMPGSMGGTPSGTGGTAPSTGSGNAGSGTGTPGGSGQ